MATSSDVLLLREPEIREVLDMASCIDAVEAALADYSAGRAELPGVIHLDVPEHRGEIHVKAGHIHGKPYYAAKFSSGFSAGDPPTFDGLVAVFDARSGAPAAILLDRGHVTDVRTGAAGGVAARHLAPPDPEVVAVIGTGTQARYQLDALAHVRSFREVRVWGRNPERADACARDLGGRPGMPEGCAVGAVASVEEAVRDADVIVTCTASTEPLLETGWLKAGAHVTALGSDAPHKRELALGVLATAELIVCDSIAQCATIGELHHAIEAGVLDEGRAVELGEIASGRLPGRTSTEQLTVCDLTGVGVQDVAAALLVMERAVARGLGKRLRV